MKQDKILLSLGLALSLLLSGCGETAPSQPAADTAAPAFGVQDMASAPQEGAKTTQGPQDSEASQASDSQASASQEPAASVEEPETARDLTDLAMESALRAVDEDGLSYDSQDGVYFWRALAYLIDRAGPYSEALEDLGETWEISQADLAPYVRALFGQEPDQYPSLGEENPLVTWEYRDGTDYYQVRKGEAPTASWTLTEPVEQENGTYRCPGQLEGAVYDLTLEAGEPAEGGPYFAYHLLAVEPAE